MQKDFYYFPTHKKAKKHIFLAQKNTSWRNYFIYFNAKQAKDETTLLFFL
jgi:hypothetical protein